MRVKLKELGRISTGNTPSKNVPEFYSSEDIGFVKPDIISELQIDYIENTTEYLSEKARNKARIVKKDAIFVTCIGNIGKIGIAKNKEFAFNQQINAIEPNEKILPEYLAYGIFANKRRLQAIANAPVVPIINKTQFSEFEIEIISDKKEQLKIVELLDKVRKIITKQKEELEKLDTLVKSRFIEMFGDPIANSFNVKTKPMTEVCEIIDGDRGKNYPTAEEFLEEGYCLFLNTKNVTSSGFNFETCMFVTKEKDEILRNGKLKRGDVVLTTRGTIGNIAFYTDKIPYEHIRINSGMVILRMHREEINEIYFIEQFKMQLADIKGKIANGSAQPQLPISKMNKIQVLLPDINLQNKFAKFVRQVDKSKFSCYTSDSYN